MIRVALVDDHSLFRSGLRGLLDRSGGVRVVGEATGGEEFLAMLPTLAVDVAMMDFSMPGMDGAEATRRALAVQPGLRVIALTMLGDAPYYARMVEAGASGFLMKDTPLDEVVGAIEAVAAGGTWFCKEVLQQALADTPPDGEAEMLSAREIEVLACVCRGLSNRQIADELFISKRTVDKHRANILEKTGCANTASLVVYAVKNFPKMLVTPNTPTK